MSGANLRIAGFVVASLLLAAPAGAAANFVVNGDFDTSLAGWTTVSSEPLWLAEDWQADSTSGAARIPDALVPNSNNVYLMQCIVFGDAAELIVQAAIRSANVGEATGSARIALAFRDGPDCDTAEFVPPYTFAIDAPELTDWTLRTSAPIAPPLGAVAAVVQLASAKFTDTGGWIADFDDVFVPEPGAAAAPAALVALAMLRVRGRTCTRPTRQSPG